MISSFRDPPHVDFTVHWTLQSAPLLRGFGHLALGNFTFKSEPFTSLAADASWDGEAWSVRDLHIVHRTGQVTGDAVQTPGEFRAKLQGNINPRALLPLLSGNAADWLSQFDFTDAPEVSLTFQGKALTLDDCKAGGQVQFGRTRYRGAPAQGLSSLAYSDHLLTLSPFPAAQGKHALIFDFERNETRSE